MTVRKYRPEDEIQLISLWNRVLWADKITVQIFQEIILLEPNFDESGFLLAEDKGEIVGAVVGFDRKTELPWGYEGRKDKEKETGYIIAFLVAPEYQRTRIGNELLKGITSFFRNSGKNYISYGGYTPSFFPSGVDPKTYSYLFSFLKRNGFAEKCTSYSMGKDLFKFQVPEEIKRLEKKLKNEKITFSFFKPQYLLPVKEFFLREFPYWLHNFVNKILHRTPYDEMVIVLKRKKVIGYCQHNYYNHLERIGPVGAASSFRGKKIGTVMLCKLLERMAEKGYRYAWFGSTDLAKSYYERMGFKAYREIISLGKEV